MNLALAHSRARAGVHAPAVRVEVHLAGGLPNFTILCGITTPHYRGDFNGYQTTC